MIGIELDITSASYVYLDFPYDKDVLEDVKELPGREFVDTNSRPKQWKFKLNKVTMSPFLKFCDKWDVDIPTAIKNRMREIVEEARELEQRKEENEQILEQDEPSLDKVYGTARGLGLYDFQKKAVEYVENNNKVIIGDEQGLGKTVEAINSIQHMDKYPALIVCPATLKYNWEKEWNTWLPRKTVKVQEASEGLDLRARVCIINYAILWRFREQLREHNWQALVLDESHKIKNGSAKRSKAAKQIARRMPEDSLKLLLSGTAVVNRPKELINQLKVVDVFEEEFGGFYPFTKRYCFPKGSPVLMSDFSTKSIENVEVGDKVMGWEERESGHRGLTETEVKETFKRTSPVQDTTLSNGEMISHTPDHEFLNGAHVRNKNCKRWVKALPGSERKHTHFDAQLAKVWTPGKPERSRDTKNYKHGYLVGAFRGDGWMTKRVKKTYKPFRNKNNGHAVDYTMGIATGDREIIDACERFLADVYDYRANRNFRDGMHRLTCGSAREKLYQGLQEVNHNDDWFAGFLAGIYDTDGSYKTFGQYKSHSQSTYNLIEEGLLRFDFDFRSHNKGHSIRGGRKAMFRFWRIARPFLRRKLKQYVIRNGGQFITDSSVKVIKTTERDEDETVHTIKTGTGNYIAHGYCVRNCEGHQGRWGWDASGAANLDELHNKLRRTCYVRRDKEDVMPELPDKQRQRLDLDISNRREYDAAESDIVAYMKKEAETGSDLLGDIDNPDEAAEQVERNMGQGPNNNMAEKLVKVMKLKQLAAKGKFKPAKSWIKDFLENESPLVVFGWHTDIVKGMADAFDAPHITGDTPSKDRHRIVEEFQDGQHDLLSLNMHAAGEGITLTEASNVAFLELPWTWGTVSQCEARVHRIGTESAVNIYFLLGNDTIDSDVFELLREKRIVSEKVNRGKDPTDGKGNIVRGVIKKLQQK